MPVNSNVLNNPMHLNSMNYGSAPAQPSGRPIEKAQTSEQLVQAHWFEYNPHQRHAKTTGEGYQGYRVAADEPQRTCIDTENARFALCSKITGSERAALVGMGFDASQFADLRKPSGGFFKLFAPCFGRSDAAHYSGRLGQGTYARVKIAKKLEPIDNGTKPESASTKNAASHKADSSEAAAPNLFAVKAFGNPKLPVYQWREGLGLMELEVVLLDDLNQHTPQADKQFLATKDLSISRTLDVEGRRCLYAFMPLGLCNFDNIAANFACEGFHKKLAKDFSPQESTFLQITAYSLLKSLANMHRLDMVHRDIKPSNMMLSTDGRCVLIDLGLARYAESEPSPEAEEEALARGGADASEVGPIVSEVPGSAEAVKQPDAAIKESAAKRSTTSSLSALTTCTGTRLYMAPELLPKQARVILKQPKALDVWSLGASLLEMAYGASAVRRMRRYPKQIIPKAELSGDALASKITGVTSFIEACLQYNPTDRPSVEALLNSPWLRDLSADDIDWLSYKQQALTYARMAE